MCLEVEVRGLLQGLDVEREDKKYIKDNFLVAGLSN